MDAITYCNCERDGQIVRIFVSGRARLSNLVELDEALRAILIQSGDSVVLDGTHLSEIDTSGALCLMRVLKDCNVNLAELRFDNFNKAHLDILHLVFNLPFTSCCVRSAARVSEIEKIGEAACRAVDIAKNILIFLGHTICELMSATRDFSKIRFKELFVQLELACIDALPIVSLVTFLIGIVITYLFATQAERYGANIFVVDAVALAMCRELSPIIVAIIVAGRSGSAYTAQIGTMKLNEEVDAMVSLGLSPMQVLVIPRLLALVVTLPLLIFVGDLVGMCGGMLVADAKLGITGVTFVERAQKVLTHSQVISGLFKGGLFAVFIAIIGCRMGLNVENNARSVGLSTTSTVVQSIVSVILLNAACAIVFIELGI